MRHEEGWDEKVTLALIIGEIVLGLVLMAAIIMQTGYTPGMSGAFGGGFQQQSGYGVKKQGVDDLLARVTVVVGVMFAVVTLLLARFW